MKDRRSFLTPRSIALIASLAGAFVLLVAFPIDSDSTAAAAELPTLTPTAVSTGGGTTPTLTPTSSAASPTATLVPQAAIVLSPTATAPAPLTPTSAPSTPTATQPVATAVQPTVAVLLTPTIAPTVTQTAASPTPTAPEANTATATAGTGGTATSTAVTTVVPTATSTSGTPVVPTATATAVATVVPTATATATLGTPTVTPTATLGTPTVTPTATLGTPTATATATLPAGSNNDFDLAVQITSFPFTATLDTSSATSHADDPDLGTGSPGPTVWYRVVAPGNGSLSISTEGSDYDTILAVFTGTRTSLNRVAFNDDINFDSGNIQSRVDFNVSSGTTYFIDVSGYSETDKGNLRLRVDYNNSPAATATPEPTATPTATTYAWATARPTYTPVATSTPGVAPPNDDFGSAIVVGSLPFTDQRNTTGATRASDDPQMGNGGPNSNTVWYRFIPTASGNFVAGTQWSNYDTVLSVFQGTTRGNLTLVEFNDDISSVVQSEVRFAAQAGTTYYIEVAQYGDVAGGGDLRLRVDSTGAVSGTPTPTGTVSAIGTPVAGVGIAPQVVNAGPIVIPPMARLSSLVLMDERYFPQTGFRVNLTPIWDFFQKRGGVRAFGYPISWEMPFMGFKVQMFQRAILQLTPSGSVVSMNLMDEGLLPYTQINGSTFPRVEKPLKEAAPVPSDPDYAWQALVFIEANVPDQWEDMQVNFLSAYMGTVRYEDAYPNGDGDASLVPLLNLELWGLPTSRPVRDPNNEGFVYQRFQRGILHHDTTTGATQGLLLADYMKSIITGENLPRDLDVQSRTSRFYKQLDPTKPGHLARPADLGGTNLEDAFTGVIE